MHNIYLIYNVNVTKPNLLMSNFKQIKFFQRFYLKESINKNFFPRKLKLKN